MARAPGRRNNAAALEDDRARSLARSLMRLHVRANEAEAIGLASAEASDPGRAETPAADLQARRIVKPSLSLPEQFRWMANDD